MKKETGSGTMYRQMTNDSGGNQIVHDNPVAGSLCSDQMFPEAGSLSSVDSRSRFFFVSWFPKQVLFRQLVPKAGSLSSVGSRHCMSRYS